MTLEIVLVLAIVALAVALFMSERLPVDLVSLTIMALLLVLGLVSPADGIAGFSNAATVTVAAMFVLSAGLTRTGAVSAVGRWLTRLFERSVWLGTAIMMALVGVVSGFINNTAAVAILMPMVLQTAHSQKISPSKLLIPLSFAGMFGGVMTLIGTSTNILVSSIAADSGLEPFGMFEMTPLGVVFLGVGLVYMLTLGVRLLPDRPADPGLTSEFEMRDYLTEIFLPEGSRSAGVPLVESPLVKDLDIDILAVRRREQEIPMPGPTFVLRSGDVLVARCDLEELRAIQGEDEVDLRPEAKFSDPDLESGQVELVEAVIAPNSPLVGRTLESSRFRASYGATVLAIRHYGEVMHEDLARTVLRAGDALLIQVRREQLDRLKQNPAFVLVSEIAVPEVRREKVITAVGILAAVVTTAAVGLAPIVVTSVAGAVAMVLTGCLSLEDAYRAIEWKVIFLLAGVLALGKALETSGGAEYLAQGLLAAAGPLGLVALVSAFYLLTSLMTETLSNNATAALLAPLAIATAATLEVDPRPFLMAVAFAASASFMTPVGYQTNTLVMAPGRYTFRDFFKVGAPLNLAFWLLATFLIPVIWPFQP